MVITILEAEVDRNNWNKLKEVFKSGLSKKPIQIKETYLIQNRENPNLWCGVSLWNSKEALEEYRKSVEVPGGVLIFRSVGAEPTLKIFDVIEH